MVVIRILLVWVAAATNLATTLALPYDVPSPNNKMIAQEHLDLGLHLDFDAWMIRHDKAYLNDGEYLNRRAIYLKNRQLVDTHNYAYQQGWTLYTMTLAGPFADLSHEEFETTYLMQSQNCSATHTSSGKVSSLARYIRAEIYLFVDSN
jgi:hypothetical protein